MKLKEVKTQTIGGSFLVYIPKVWAISVNLEQGDSLEWFMEEGDHEVLILRKKTD